MLSFRPICALVFLYTQLISPVIADLTSLTGVDNTANATTLQPQFFKNLKSKRTKLAYGPFHVPPTTSQDSIAIFTDFKATTPCTNCTITWMQAGLEYPNGSYANANTSMWLHHAAIFNSAAQDSVCVLPPLGERFFASGNERTVANLCANGTSRTGYYLSPHSTFLMTSELMNMLPVAQSVLVTVEYEYIPGRPSHFKHIKPVWLDIANCSNPEIRPMNQELMAPKTYQKTKPWVATFGGKIVTAIGHLHDGVTAMRIVRKHGGGKEDTVCNFTPVYGGDPGFIDPPSGPPQGPMTMPPNGTKGPQTDLHISRIDPCNSDSIMQGQKYSLEADYDFSKHPPMKNKDGSLSPLMGIGLVYVALDGGKGGARNASSARTTATSSSTGPAQRPTKSKSGEGRRPEEGRGMVAMGIMIAGVVAAVI